jgi:competence protein ComEA
MAKPGPGCPAREFNSRFQTVVEARAKGKFKNWDDFVARKVVPSNAEAAIKDLVSF